MEGSQFEGSRGKEVTQHPSQIRMVYAYYCKLSQRKIKHKMFDEVESKTNHMDLHEFMTLCKDLNLIRKHKKKDSSQNKEKKAEYPISRVDIISSPIGTEHNPPPSSAMDSEEEDSDDAYMSYVPEMIEAEKERRLNRESVNARDSIGHSAEKSSEPAKDPQVYLSNKKLAELFKQEANIQGQVDFQGFMKVLGNIALLMYGSDDPQTHQKLLQSRLKNKTTNTKAKPRHSRSEDSRIQLLKFMHLNSKEGCLQVYKHINELHGGMEHLALMRSPIKRVKVKNSPMGKYDRKSKQNTMQSSTKEQGKTGKASLPQLGKKKAPPNGASIKDTNSYLAKYSKIQDFVKSHQKEIDALNCNTQSRVMLNPSSPQPNFQATLDVVESRPKKYSQRHTDKMVKDPAYKQFTKYIDFSSPYDDQIFNQFVNMNQKGPSPGQAASSNTSTMVSNFATLHKAAL